MRAGCRVCGIDFRHFDSADGPAVFIMLIVGFLVAGLALVVELSFSPPYWVHVALWLPLTIVVALVLLPVFKAALIAAQHRHDACEWRIDG